MDWRIPEKLKKGVSYSQFSIILGSMNGNVKRFFISATDSQACQRFRCLCGTNAQRLINPDDAFPIL